MYTRALSYRIIILLMQLLTLCFVMVIAIFLLALIAPYLHNALRFQYIRTSLGIENYVSSFVRGVIPTRVMGIDLTRFIVIIGAFFLIGIPGSVKEHYRDKLSRLKLKKEFEEWKSRMRISDKAALIAPLRSKIENLEASNKTDREELLKLFAETKKKLDSMGRDLAFLSIDVCGSTEMKVGEEKAAIEHDFKEYKHFVEYKLKTHGALKSAWTPDGVMSCFATVDAAVKAAREIIDGLVAFNKNIKTMRKDFVLRCGINAGYVYFDDSLPMEEMSDRVIDVAGHMQKHATPNTICIAKPAIEPLQDRDGFVPTTRVVDGYEVYMSERRKVPRE
jgi:class 3 adenylate cyclase